MIPPIEQTADFAIAICSDLHPLQTQHWPRVETALAWAFAQTPSPCVLLDCGDSHKTEVRDRLSTIPGWEDRERKYVIVPGNHDTDVSYYDTEYSGQVPAQPFSDLIEAFPDLFTTGQPYYSIDLSNEGRATYLRIVVANTNAPNWNGTEDTFWNCNPPGYVYQENEDYTGLSDPQSLQRFFLDQVLNAPDRFVILAGHRPRYGCGNTEPRPCLPATHWLPIRSTSLVVGGDIHRYGLFADPSDGGRLHLTHAGGFALRPVGVDHLPGWLGGDPSDYTTNPNVRFADGSVLPATGIVHVSHLAFWGDTAVLKTFRCSAADPVGVVVYTDTLVRVGGVAGALGG